MNRRTLPNVLPPCYAVNDNIVEPLRVNTMLWIVYYLITCLPLPLSGILSITTCLAVYLFVQYCMERPPLAPHLHYKDSDLAKYVLKRVKSLSLPYR